MISEESVREVLETARVEDVVGDYVNLRRSGQNLTGLCPFHNEKTPSFNVNPARNIYKCFGCGEGGDPVKFLMTLEQLSFPDAIRRLAARYNLKLDETEVSQEEREEKQEKESLLLVNEFAQRWFADQLYKTDEGKSVGLSYFRSRGFRQEVMEKFGLGYAPLQRDGLYLAATKAGYPAEQLQQLGLVRDRRDFFFDRVMFTIHNLQGKPIAFAGRILKKDVKAPKYVNSPESEVYHKSDVLYGLYQARQAVRKLDNVYMVEGYTDVISLHQSGIENVVATSGTSLTPGQARLVGRQTENVTLLYDGDKAGIKAALRGVDVLLLAGLNVRVVVLPDGEDPDSYLQRVGATSFGEFLEQNRQDFLFFKADLLLGEAGNDVAGRSDAIRSSIATLALVEDPLKRAGYLQQFTAKLGLEESLLVNLVNQAIAERRAEVRRDQEREERQRERRARDLGAEPSPPPRHDFPAEDDAWAGLTEPGFAEGSDAPPPVEWDGWEGLEEPGYETAQELPPGEFVPPIGAPPRNDAVADALLYSGHTFQEKELTQLLIHYGSKDYNAEGTGSIAAYLTHNVADMLADFDGGAYRKVFTLALDYVAQHHRGPAPEWYMHHPDPEVREVAAFVPPTYPLSPNWKEKYKVYLRQKPPEENYVLVAENLLRIFRLAKIDRKCRDNLTTIRQLEAAEDWPKVELHTKLQMRLNEMRRALASELGTVATSNRKF
ncbi:DNA primase [Neolewinella lacunae]|uniref:DNA primase n=1 Tax=Neolewinella lacunae TaxID=1517758 RepID=A0A923PMV6_9BACT|nr:DNA primase [Neolewinella lacunae]MBC6993442.1 DNA primase [Neolewinella lacunae]MDN3636282.1 DNA primase [Neolewinella lacunae]